ncbi:MAG: TonB-dependent receptor [Balneolaceae bacterium]
MRVLILFLYLFSTAYLQAQTKPDTVATGEFTIEATRIHKPNLDQPVHVSRIDSARIALQKGMDIGDVLSQHSFLYIRNNGPGAASVISQRGFGGEQTRVLWEGMPINHQMLGVTDLSLLPAGTFSEIEVTSGSGSSLYGSGISGTVYLKSSPQPDQVSLGQSVGSFGNYITNGSAGISLGEFTFNLKGSTQNNENSYRYYDQSTGSVENRSRGAFENDQIIGGLNWKKNNLSAKSSLWWSRADHEITENIYSGPGSATQFDESVRWVNSMKLYADNFVWEGKIYLAKTALDYFNPDINTESKSESRDLNAEFSTTWFFSENLELNGNISGMITEVETNNYSEIKSRKQFSSGVNAAIIPIEKLKIYPAFRLDHYSDFGTAVSPSIGFNIALIEDEFALRGSVARNFRAPTFNDLYWPDGGNENLKAERGVKSEVGLVHEKTGAVSFSQQLSFFYINMDEGIKWLPNSSGRFQAQNIQEITSRGMEWSGGISTQIANWQFGSDHSVAYTRAFISEERFSGDAAVGNQLPYIPQVKYSGSVHLAFTGFSVMFNGVYVDERFTTEQANEITKADSYLVFDATFNYSRNISKTEISVIAKANNLFDESYSIVRFYPMPLRNFLINLTLTQKF